MKLEKIWIPVWRLLLLTSFGGVCFALLTVILRPTATSAEVAPFDFPDQLPLANWRLVETESLEGPGPGQQGALYRYAQIAAQSDSQPDFQSDRSLEVELWYGRNGNVCRRLLQQELAKDDGMAGEGEIAGEIDSEQAQAPSIHETADGLYRYGSQSGESYLQSVIDSRGDNLVSYDQFVRNRYQYFLRPQSMLRWLVGRESIVGDHDCLSTELLLTADPNSATDNRVPLESAWQDLSRWGREQLNSKS
ncbi:MAG: cyanoexosortase A system-associated protein [Cyanobacteria bacterium P01_D01_bin.1]